MINVPICLICKHLKRDRKGLPYCDAFPNGNIPFKILSGESFHKRPFKNQKGDTVFELSKTADIRLKQLFEEVLE